MASFSLKQQLPLQNGFYGAEIILYSLKILKTPQVIFGKKVFWYSLKHPREYFQWKT